MNKATEESAAQFERLYQNKMQAQATLIDANVMFGRIARAGGKTEGFFTPRMIRVGFDMPRELSFLIHKSYVALFSNVVPNILAAFNKTYGARQKPLLEEGIDYIIGSAKLPSHFLKPRQPVAYPKHALIFRSGHHFQMVASDLPDSMAGRSGVHAFIEEMKHNKGENLKSRIFPGLRGGLGKTRQSPYYEGITGVSDTARVDLGEDNWFEEYEKNMNPDLINEIATMALSVNSDLVELYKLNHRLTTTTNISSIKKIQQAINPRQRRLDRDMARLREMRHAATYFITASTFVNKDFLGTKFFKTQLETLTTDEFLCAICNIAPTKVVEMFFAGFGKQHCFEDSYKYHSILSLDLKDDFTLDASYLKHYNPKEPLIIGYDPGYFSSIVVAQENKKTNELVFLKEFYCYGELTQGELARQFWAFFFPAAQNRGITFYYDRAGNKRREIQEQITTDSRLLKAELEKYKFNVRMKNERQRTIFYYEHYKLLVMLLSEKLRQLPKLRFCINECKNLISSIYLSPVAEKDGRIVLDKTSERKVAPQYQAGLTTQLPSAAMYLIFGMYERLLPNDLNKTPSLPENLSI